MEEIYIQIQIARLHMDQIYQFPQDRIEMDQVNSIMEVRPRRIAAIILGMEPRFPPLKITVKFKTIISNGKTMEPTQADKVKPIFKWRKILGITPIIKIYTEVKLMDQIFNKMGIKGNSQLIPTLILIGKMEMILSHHKLKCGRMKNSWFLILGCSHSQWRMLPPPELGLLQVKLQNVTCN